jgi:hypothetical protein
MHFTHSAFECAHDPAIFELHARIAAGIAELGSGGGAISASIYDTAQRLRLAPTGDDAAALRWLSEHQAADGGWGDPAADARARTVPTLAAALALHRHQFAADRVTAAGFWLQQTAEAWQPPLPDDLPVGVELLLPRLLDAAQGCLDLPFAGYAALRALGRRRMDLLATFPSTTVANGPFAHSWEGWAGAAQRYGVVHPCNGVGCSPAASAAWLAATGDDAEFAAQRRMLSSYLARAEQAVADPAGGLLPTAFPIDRFEQAYSLHTLAQFGLLQQPELLAAARPVLDTLAHALTAGGIGCADGFLPDADDTAAALGALSAAGYPVTFAALAGFQHGDHFATYPRELQPSVITTARAAQVMARLGVDPQAVQAWLSARQQPDGFWPSDKWNGEVLYATLQAMLALHHVPAAQGNLQRAAMAILQRQLPDGSWGNAEASAYALLALRLAPQQPEYLRHARRAGWHFLARHEDQSAGRVALWLAKERYCPARIANITILTALLVGYPDAD